MTSMNPMDPMETLGGQSDGFEAGTTVMIDNYDSFSYNVTQYLSILGANVVTYRNDEITIDQLVRLKPRNIVISPGPGHPDNDAGISSEIIRHFAGKIPILGVCMGCQCIARVYGGKVESIGDIVHGKTSPIHHDGKGIYKGLPQGFLATRYHSLAPTAISIAADHPDLEISSRTKEGIIMGLRHRKYTIESVQYHPESILSQGGHLLLRNFMHLTGGTWAENPSFDMGTKVITNGSAVNGASSILNQIFAKRSEDVQALKMTHGTRPQDLEKGHGFHLAPPLIDFRARLRDRQAGAKLAVMGEIKRASPSKGIFDIEANAPELALEYAKAGASVISVLTEPHWFKGSLDDLRQVRLALDQLPNRPAVLRKDFILDEYQIMEARLAGADTVLLIVAMLSDEKLKSLYAYSQSLSMEPLVEVNNSQEMKRALDLGAKVIGVNNRNLHDFSVDLSTTSSLVDMVPKDVTLCALSGIRSRADVEQYESAQIGAVLVGEYLMLAKDKRAFIAQLLNVTVEDDLASEAVTSSKPVKPYPVHDVTSIKLKPYQTDLISTSLANKILLFGSFTLKSGRVSPYFFNAGLFCTGALLELLASCFASSIIDSGIEFDVIFGPAYKGVPLATATATALVKNHGLDVPWCFNRKEAKDHGEGGSLVGASLKGKRVLMVDDVITDGAAKREAYEIIKAAGGQLAAIFVSVDREEMTLASEARTKDQGPRTSGLQDVSRDLGCPVRSIVRLHDIINYITLKGNMQSEIKAMMEYRARYGVDTTESTKPVERTVSNDDTSVPVQPDDIRPLVKVCGLKTPAAAKEAIAAGADLLGIIFAPASRRKVSIDEAHAVAKVVRGARHGREPARPVERGRLLEDWFRLEANRIKAHPRKPLLVGVFQNQPLDWIRDVVDAIGLDLVQLHGSEPLEWTRWIQVPVIKAFHVPRRADEQVLQNILTECTRAKHHSLVLLDSSVSASGGVSGGAGQPFDWTIASRLVQGHYGNSVNFPIVLAGGLTIDNVQEAISTVRPFMVDVNSGVETDGAKDLGKIRDFVKLVKG